MWDFVVTVSEKKGMEDLILKCSETLSEEIFNILMCGEKFSLHFLLLVFLRLHIFIV